MIKEIQLTNFQNHGQSTLVLSPGVNVIAGPSDNGKSAIIRAIRWVILNKPQGDSFIKNGEDNVAVTIATDINSITRAKSKKANIYVLDKTEFKAMRGSVPSEIQDALDIGPANLQSQHDPYYMLTMSPGDVARHLNSIAGLCIIDTSIKRANSLIADSNIKARAYTEAIEKAEQQLEEYADLEAIASLINRITGSFRRQEQRLATVQAIMAAQDAIHEHEAAIAHLNVLLTARPQVEALKQALSDLEEKKTSRNTLSTFINELRVCRAGLDGIKDTTGAAEALTDLKTHVLTLIDYRNDAQNLMQLCSDFDKAVAELCHTNDMIKSDKQRIAEIKQTIKVCPTCGAIMPETQN